MLHFSDVHQKKIQCPLVPSKILLSLDESEHLGSHSDKHVALEPTGQYERTQQQI